MAHLLNLLAMILESVARLLRAMSGAGPLPPEGHAAMNVHVANLQELENMALPVLHGHADHEPEIPGPAGHVPIQVPQVPGHANHGDPINVPEIAGHANAGPGAGHDGAGHGGAGQGQAGHPEGDHVGVPPIGHVDKRVHVTTAVWNNKTGCYHFAADCPGLRNKMTVLEVHSESEAMGHGLRLCLWCLNRGQ